MAVRPEEQQAAVTPSGSSEDSGHIIERNLAISQAVDPMLKAFAPEAPQPPRPERQTPSRGTDGRFQPAEVATPPAPTPAGQPAPEQPAKPPEPSPEPRRDMSWFDTASPDEIRAWARSHPTMSRAMGLEVREHIQRRDAQFQQERQAREQAQRQAQAAQQQAQVAQEQARKSAELYPAFYDEDDPRHLDALRHFAELGVAPVEIDQVISSPVVNQHVQAVASQAAQQAYQQAYATAQDQALTAAIQAASQHPVLGKLGDDALEDVWQKSDGSVVGFYADAFERAGYLNPKAAQDYRAAAEAEARTRVYGDYPPAEGSVVTGSLPPNGLSIPADKRQIEPSEWFLRGFSRTANAQRAPNGHAI